jgi:hypothetical protein
MLLIILAITNALSQDLSRVWCGNAKTPDDNEILFLCHFDKDPEIHITKISVPISGLVGVKPKSTSLTELTK